MISIIAAVSDNNVIGKDNNIIWHLPDDFKYFKEKTNGHHIIMGRKTFESIGKPLPNRTSIVITHQENYGPESTLREPLSIAHSLEEALQLVHPYETEVFIIGGSEIYKQALDIADTLYITNVHESFDGDVYFPEVDYNLWNNIFKKIHEIDENHKQRFTFNIYTRKK